jgi:aspartate racemase
VGTEDLVAICNNRSPETVVGILAVLKSGGAFLPIDLALPRERVLGMLADAHPKLVLCDKPDETWLQNAGWEAYCVDDLQPVLAAMAPDNLPRLAAADNAAYAIYTSGSTGKPKGVVVNHGALVNHSLAAALRYGIAESDRRLQFASMSSDMFVAEIFNYLTRGAALVFGFQRANPSVREFLEFIDEHRITITGVPSSWWSEWVAGLEQAGYAVPSSLRAVITGMEKLNPAAFLTWKRMVGDTVRLFNAYGPTETTATATVYEAGSSEWESGSFVPIGKPLANVTTYVLDQDDHPSPFGVIGELHIGGAGVAREYLHSPDLTERSFVMRRLEGIGTVRLYKTGDLVFCLPDGNLVFVGRADRQVKIRGFRIELEEIETVLAEAPGVYRCAVVAVGIEGREDLVAYYSGSGKPFPAPDDLREFLGRRLPAHMIPGAFMRLEEMPMTAAGKVDRKALPEYDPKQNIAEQPFSPPSTPTEQRLAGIWETILGVQRLSTHDNFFTLGADSLDATRLVTALEAAFGREISLDSLWRAATLGQMASLLDQERISAPAGIAATELVTLQPEGTRRPFFCFPGGDDNPYYFSELAAALGNNQPFYVVRDPRPLKERDVYSVEDVAGRFIHVMRSVQAKGPYLVGGHCYGGLIAFEIARQLAAAGDKATQVVLFEVAAPGYPKVLRHWKRYGRQVLAVARGKQRVPLPAIRSHLQVLFKLFRRKATAARLRLSQKRSVQAVIELRPSPEAVFIHPNARAGRGYHADPFPCDLVHIIAADELHSTVVLDDPRLGWKEIARGGSVVIVNTSGKADQIFKEPFVTEMAARLQPVLDSVNERKR